MKSMDHRQSAMTLKMADNSVDAPDLIFGGLTGHDELARPYLYEVLLFTEDSGHAAMPSIISEEQWNAIIGGFISISLEISSYTGAKSIRYFTGVIHELIYEGQVGNTGVSVYKAILVPRISTLQHTHNYRSFTSLTVPQVISAILDHAGFGKKVDYQININNDDHLTRAIINQYDESDFNFIHRLMEDEGISYYFQHKKDHHCMIFTDAKSHLHDISESPMGGEKMRAMPVHHRQNSLWRKGEQGIWNYHCSRRMHPLHVKTSHYSYHHASAFNIGKPEFVHEQDIPYGKHNPWMTCFYQQGGHFNPDHSNASQQWSGQPFTRTKARQHANIAQTQSMETNMRHMQTGYEFELADHPHASENQKHRIIASKFQVGTEQFPLARTASAQRSSTGEVPHDPIFKSQLQLLSSSVPHAPASQTPRPKIHGVQTAKVVYTGSTAKAVDVTELGEIYVKFNWQRAGQALNSNNTSQTSVKVRVAQIWAGKSRGALFIPRVGDEVVVAFEDGDPDKPIVVGSVYNTVNTPFIDPSKSPLISGIRTRVSKSDGSDLGTEHKNFNHSNLLFNDLAGSKTMGLSLRCTTTSAGCDYELGGSEETMPNTVDGSAGFTICAPNSGLPDMALCLNAGYHLTTQWIGNQDTVWARLDRLKYENLVGDLTSHVMNCYRSSEGSFLIKKSAIFSLKMENPIAGVVVGPLGCKMEALFGSVALRSGLPSNILQGFNLALRVGTWGAELADRFRDADADAIALCKNIFGGAGIVTGIVDLLMNKCPESGLNKFSEVKLKPGVLTQESGEIIGIQSTKSMMLPDLLRTVSENGPEASTAIWLSPAQHRIESSEAVLLSSQTISASGIYCQIASATQVSMSAEDVVFSVAMGTTKLNLGVTSIQMSTGESASGLLVSPSINRLWSVENEFCVSPMVVGAKAADGVFVASAAFTGMGCGASKLGQTPAATFISAPMLNLNTGSVPDVGTTLIETASTEGQLLLKANTSTAKVMLNEQSAQSSATHTANAAQVEIIEVESLPPD